ncbi:MAG: TIGR00282 family metallophosphoesterase [Clostridia bacterium]|nr:TIGR00282 family metallophosphoesterase [Clostridia bacterium]
MNILIIGDIVGSAGINAVKELMPKIKKEYKIDFVIANAENAAGGKGLNISSYDSLYMQGVEVFTMGNHTWAKKEIFNLFEEKDNIIRPANYSNDVPGLGYCIKECKNKKILIISLIGRVDMGISADCPFEKAKEIIASVKSEENIDIVIVDFHAEATAEKIALGYYLKSLATIVYGTHTHVQTADEKVYNTGMAYITDVGMTGPKDSVIGLKYEVALKRFLTQIPEKYVVADGGYILNGIVCEIDDVTNKAVNIKRIQM